MEHHRNDTEHQKHPNNKIMYNIAITKHKYNKDTLCKQYS